MGGATRHSGARKRFAGRVLLPALLVVALGAVRWPAVSRGGPTTTGQGAVTATPSPQHLRPGRRRPSPPSSVPQVAGHFGHVGYRHHFPHDHHRQVHSHHVRGRGRPLQQRRPPSSERSHRAPWGSSKGMGGRGHAQARDRRYRRDADRRRRRTRRRGERGWIGAGEHADNELPHTATSTPCPAHLHGVARGPRSSTTRVSPASPSPGRPSSATGPAIRRAPP